MRVRASYAGLQGYCAGSGRFGGDGFFHPAFSWAQRSLNPNSAGARSRLLRAEGRRVNDGEDRHEENKHAGEAFIEQTMEIAGSRRDLPR
jgi:hypothetical protein